MSSNSTSMFEFDSQAGAVPKDALFFERLDTFMEKSLGDIRAFAERESRPYEETRRCIAQWHAKYLFQPSTASCSTQRKADRVRATLCDTSRILESLSETSGVQSFLLAVDPDETSDGGFLGGSVIGREFWRGIRGGGEAGARGFKSHCTAHLQGKSKSKPVHPERHTSTPPPKGGPARSIKNELYESVRNALRVASGFRNAEMKWTNPERLDVYGVRLVGWPEGVSAQNPSTLKVGQNRVLLEAIQSGSMRFERIATGHVREDVPAEAEGEGQDDDFSWAYDADASLSSPPPQNSAAVSSSSAVVSTTTETSVDHSSPEHNPWTLHPLTEAGMPLSSYSLDYSWDGDLNERMTDGLGEADSWDSEVHSEAHLQPERPRKRQRSEELFFAMDN